MQILTKPPKQTRKAYTLTDKVRAILLYFVMLNACFLTPGKCAAVHLNIKKGTIDNWIAAKESILYRYLTYPNLRHKKRIRICRGKFHAEELLLYSRFVHRRKVLKLPVSQNWLSLEFKKIVQDKKPDGYEDFKYSNHWVCGFCIRFLICSRAMTNKKDKSVEERLPDIRRLCILQ